LRKIVFKNGLLFSADSSSTYLTVPFIMIFHSLATDRQQTLFQTTHTKHFKQIIYIIGTQQAVSNIGCIYIYMCVCVCVCVCLGVCVCVYSHILTLTQTQTCTHTLTNKYACMYVFACMCLCMYGLMHL
jgi:hypothetical protein